MSTSKTTKKELKPKQLKPIYHPLVLYNLFSAVLWSTYLYSVITIGFKVGPVEFYETSKNTLTMIQSFAIIEIFNSLFGFVRSPLFTVISQVTSRLVVVWGIFQYLPDSPGPRGIQFFTLTIAWCLAEIVRYVYYFFNLAFEKTPDFLSVLRYNLFWVLYPLGVGSELYIIYLSLNYTPNNFYKYVLIAVMLLYIPGFPVLFKHMMSQRKKVMKQIFGKPKSA